MNLSHWKKEFMQKSLRNIIQLYGRKKANSLRRYGKQKTDGINGLIQNLSLDGLETENHFDPKNDDLADWFSGSPDWVRGANYPLFKIK